MPEWLAPPSTYGSPMYCSAVDTIVARLPPADNTFEMAASACWVVTPYFVTMVG